MAIKTLIVFLGITTIIDAGNTENNQVNGIFEKVTRQILLKKMPKNRHNNPSDEIELSSTIFANLLWEIEENLIEKTIVKNNYLLNGKIVNFFEILQTNGFLAKNDKILNELKREKVLEILTTEDAVKMMNLLLSFAIRLGYHLGSEELNKNRPNGMEIKLEKFMMAYNCVEKAFPVVKNSISILPISILDAKSAKSVIVNFNKQQDVYSRNYKIYNFETIRWLLDWKKHSLEYWVNLLERRSDEVFMGRYGVYEDVKKPLDRLMISWTGNTGIAINANSWSGFNFYEPELCALFNFGVNMAERIGKNFPEKKAEMKTFAEIMTEKLEIYRQRLENYQRNCMKEKEVEMHYEDAIFVDGMQNDYRQIEPEKNLIAEKSEKKKNGKLLENLKKK